MSERSNEEGLPVVVFTEHAPLTDEAKGIIQDVGRMIWSDAESEEELIAIVRKSEATAIVSEYTPITRRVMKASKSIRGIVAFGAGFDQIDVEAASEMGIYVVNARGANANSVAEHVFALLLGLTKRSIRSNAFVKEGRWETPLEVGLPPDLMPIEIFGKTIGIIGLGAIGTRVSRIAQGFNLRVIALDPYADIERARGRGVELVDKETLFRESDFISVNCVLNEETRGMIGDEEFNLMKPTAYLINTARGPIVDEEALIRALREGKIAGAGLDVFATEPVDVDNPLLKFENVIVSPHCAGATRVAIDAVALRASEEVARILRGEVPKSLVNREQLRERGYRV